MKKVKKLISIILILILTIVPFLPILNVAAEDELIITTYGENEEGINPNLVTNKANLMVEGVTNGDELAAYKIIDVFYNEATNEMSYDFTSDFQAFLTQSTNESYKNMTIEDYFNLTSDYSSSVINASTLDILVSQYTTYIRSNAAVSGITMDVKEVDYSVEKDLEAGAYLILPTKVTTRNELEESAEEGNRFFIKRNNYGVMVANIVFDSAGGTWSLNDRLIYAKKSNNHFDTMLFNFSTKQYTDFLNGVEVGDVLLYYQSSLSSHINRKKIYTLELWDFQMPTNAVNKQATFTIEIPEGINYDKDNIYTLNDFGYPLTKINDGKIIYEGIEIGTITLEDKKITITLTEPDKYKYALIIFDFWLNENATVGIEGNEIKASLTVAEEPYVENGTTNLEITNTIYTYGLELTSYNNDNTILLKGAKYEVYTKEDLSTDSLLGEFEVGEDGTGTFAGVAEGAVYLKQTKAPAGYQLMKETIPVKIATEDSTDTDSDYYYEVTTSNQKMWFLPSTGGAGTIIYTLIGLGIIIASSIGIIYYRKKKQNNTKNK